MTLYGFNQVTEFDFFTLSLALKRSFSSLVGTSISKHTTLVTRSQMLVFPRLLIKLYKVLNSVNQPWGLGIFRPRRYLIWEVRMVKEAPVAKPLRRESERYTEMKPIWKKPMTT